MTEQEQIAALLSEHDELEAWRNVGARLWPFVRPWGLCGGHPDAIQASADLAGLLGVCAENQVNEKVALLVRKQTIAEIVKKFEDEWFRKMMRKDSESFVRELESM